MSWWLWLIIALVVVIGVVLWAKSRKEGNGTDISAPSETPEAPEPSEPSPPTETPSESTPSESTPSESTEGPSSEEEEKPM